MKHTILRGLSAEALRASVPPRYRSRLPRELPAARYTLLLFRHDRRDVVQSRAVSSALAAVPDSAEPFVAVGGCFTAEGMELLGAHRAVVVQLAEFHWTDESYQAIRERQ